LKGSIVRKVAVDKTRSSLERVLVTIKRLRAGICKHVRFCWIFVRQAGGAPFHRILAACVIGNVFKPFLILLCPDSSSAQFPKRLAHGELARYKAPSLNRELVCPNRSRKSADPQDRTRIREHPPSNQSLTSACQGFLPK
jgi:hypothetical protein